MTDAFHARARALRQQFDAAFAEPLRVPDGARIDLLAVRAGGERLAFRVEDLAGVATGRPVVPLPAGPPALRGVAGWGGRPVAVYSLARLLGADPGDEGWLALCRADEPFAVAFDALDGYLRVTSEALRPRGAGGGPVVGEVLSTPEGARGVCGVGGLSAEVHRLATAGRE